jgi:hypothetical protein
LTLLGNPAEYVPADRIQPPKCVEETENPLGLLKGLNQPIQQDPIKAAVMPTDAALVVFEERVHERPPVSEA